MRKTFEASAETTAILNVLCSMKMSQEMTFDELSALVRFNVTSTSSAYHSARRMAERDHGIYIATIRGRGFMRGTGEDMADSLEPLARRMRRTAKKSIDRADLAIRHNLTEEKHKRVAERRQRASIIYSTTSAPMPASNRQRRQPAQEAPKVNVHSIIGALT